MSCRRSARESDKTQRRLLTYNSCGACFSGTEMRPIVKGNLRRQGDGAFAEYEKARLVHKLRHAREYGARQVRGAQGTLRAPSITDIGPVRH